MSNRDIDPTGDFLAATRESQGQPVDAVGRNDLVERLDKRIGTWARNSDKARVTVNLGQLRAYRTALAEKAARIAEAERYAERLATVLWEKHYKAKSPDWEPLSGDLIGILSQIDNMTSGLVPRAECEGLRAALTLVRSIIVDGAMTGFNCHDGDWAERLYASQAVSSAALGGRNHG